ncbi:MAG: UbiA family prenyltransferase [Desulfosarcina sp.]|nr:UbiA family prenyltransferase [Desulfobacterales bacterium]
MTIGSRPLQAQTHSRHFHGAERLKLFWALSRTPHGLIDMTTPCLAALLWLGAYPPFLTILVGLLTVFAGYTAVYALNDIVGYRSDQAKLKAGGFNNDVHANDLDALLVRHPMAQGLLPFRDGVVWAAGWGLVAAGGAYWLNPVCLVIFAAGCLLETVYCILWRVSPYRVFVSGAVKSVGALAAVFAVDPHPSSFFLVFLFLMIFLWEIGGQNAPNDWTDIEEDRKFGARTIPVIFGQNKTRDIILGSLFFAVLANLVLFRLSQAHFGPLALTATAGVGFYLLLWPAWQLHGSTRKADAMRLFNRASYYPLALFVIVALRLLV